MALIQCSECGNQISSNAASCPHCGNPIKKTTTTIPVYETKTARVTCWGLGASNAIADKLSYELNFGWEIVSIIEDHWRGGLLRHVYTVVLKRKHTENKPSYFSNLSKSRYSSTVYKEKANSGWICKKCGARNNSNALFCGGCGTYK